MNRSTCCQDVHAYHDSFDVVSLPYRAPELVYGAKFTFPIDTWAAGITLAELFCGRPLIQPASRGGLALQMAQLLGQPPPGLFDGSKCPVLEQSSRCSGRP
mmetsp:Transcript_33394/g.83342  ORF Transcript_33394/g.83342 Transcript_33394/m.83342 type:complete len:101 (-) Transcript_33394:742-1044(-)|eukprot:6873412-Prymnesium_polylepis.3